MSSEKEILTTFEAARYCHVHPGTIKNWIRSDYLKAFKTPGGHRRIYRRDLDKFLRDRNIPVNHEVPGQRKRVLIVEPNYKVRESIAKLLHRWGGAFEVAAVDNAFEGGEMLAVFKPELIIIDLATGGMEPGELCSHIRGSLSVEGVKIIALDRAKLADEELDADAVIKMPLDIRRLRQEIEKIVEIKKGIK